MHDSGRALRLVTMQDAGTKKHVGTTDADLMQAAGSGDLAAFGLLVDRHHQRALNFAYRLCGDGEHAQDIVQESFLRILKAAHRYRPRGQFTTYLYSVVRNLTREAARRSRTRRESRLDEQLLDDDAVLSQMAHTNPPDPDSLRERRELRDALVRALQALSEPHRTVFVLSEMDRLSYEEIAQICGCRVGTVASRKHAAVMKLRVLLGSTRSGQ